MSRLRTALAASLLLVAASLPLIVLPVQSHLVSPADVPVTAQPRGPIRWVRCWTVERIVISRARSSPFCNWMPFDSYEEERFRWDLVAIEEALILLVFGVILARAMWTDRRRARSSGLAQEPSDGRVVSRVL